MKQVVKKLNKKIVDLEDYNIYNIPSYSVVLTQLTVRR